MFSADNQDEMVECPYNKVHRMLRKRLQQHLLKCRLSYPDVELRKCPFNQTHLIPEPEFVHHATNCPDRKLITQYKYGAPAEDTEELRVKHEPIECEENWDDTEVEDYNPKKYVEEAKIIRLPVGALPSERKAFIKQERKRLGDYDSDDEKPKVKKDLDRPDTSDEESDYVYNRRRPMTPPPPTNVAWFEDVKGDNNQQIPERNVRNGKISGGHKKPKSNVHPYQSKGQRHSDSRYHGSHRASSSNNRNYQENGDQHNFHTLDDDPYYNSGSSQSNHYNEFRGIREGSKNRARNKHRSEYY